VSATPARAGHERALLLSLAGAALTYSLMQSLVIPALPAIQRSLHASPDATSWTVTGFLLSSSVATPIAGRVGDMYGKRRVLVAVLAIVSAGTLLCTLPSMPALLAGRVVQGVSGGVLPLGYAIVRDELRPQRVAAGIALLASQLGVGAGLGVIIAGLLVEHLPYTSLFWLQLPGFLLVAYCVRRYVPESPVRTAARIDWLGAILVSAGLVTLLLTVTQAQRWGLGSVRTVIGVALAAVLLVLWGRSALTRTHPLLDLRLMRRRAVWTPNAIAFLVGVAQFAGFILVPQYVQEPAVTGYGFGASPVGSGLFLLPMTVALALGGSLVGPLERRIGARALLMIGNAFTACAFLLLTFARGHAFEVYLASGLLGAGVGLSMAALAALIVSAVAQTETGAAAGVNNVARTLGGAIGGQLAAALLAAGAGIGGLPVTSAYTGAFGVGLGAMVLAIGLGPLLPKALDKPIAAAQMPALP
jgi:MFS family permease